MILSILSIYVFYKILRNMFSEMISLIGTLIFSLYPLNVYSVSQISSITLQVFFYCFIFFHPNENIKKIKFVKII